jgi:uncharacterized protein (TIGR02217 family)
MPVASNPTFPVLPGLTVPVTRTPLWATLNQISLGGVDAPNQPWTYPRYRWTLTFEFLRQAAAFGELQSLMGFFNRMGGRYGVFQYDDPQDDTTVADQAFGTGDGTTTTFQLVRTRGSFVEPVFAVNAITNLKVAGVAKSNPADYTVSNKGVVTFVVAPGAATALTWTGTYLWFCRFDKDDQDFDQNTVSTAQGGPLWAAKGLSFSSIKFGS